MENRDSEPAAAGIDMTATGFSAAVKNLQVFAEEIGRVSRSSFVQNAKLIDDLSTAREVGDIVAIQTKFMTGMIETFNEHVRLMMSRMANFPLGAANLAESFSEPRADLAQTAEKAAEQAGPVTSDAGLEPQPNGAAGAASDTHAGFETGANLPQAESEATQTTEAAEQDAQAATDEVSAPAAEITPAQDTLAMTRAYARFTVGEELGEAGVDAGQEAAQSATETTQWAAKASREAWQELAKAAAELLRAEPLPAEPVYDAETPDTPQNSDASDHQV